MSTFIYVCSEGTGNRGTRSYTPLDLAAIVVGIYRIDRVTLATRKRFRDLRLPRILPRTNIDISDKRDASKPYYVYDKMQFRIFCSHISMIIFMEKVRRMYFLPVWSEMLYFTDGSSNSFRFNLIYTPTIL